MAVEQLTVCYFHNHQIHHCNKGQKEHFKCCTQLKEHCAAYHHKYDTKGIVLQNKRKENVTISHFPNHAQNKVQLAGPHDL